LKKIVLSITIFGMLQATWIEDNMINVGNDSGYYQTQTRNIYSLGSETIKFRETGGTITPFHMEPPRFNVGCGAIDLSMGGFSYLNRDFVVEKLKAISASAPAFVYQMAISALCKDCQNIMNELEKFSNMMNGMNLDTCDAVQMAQGAGKNVGEAMNNTIASGQTDSWTSQRLKSGREAMNGWKNNLKSFFGGDAIKADEMMEILVLKGSLLHIVSTKGLPDISKLDLLNNDANQDKLILSIFRAAIGDIIGGEDADGKPTAKIIPGGTINNLFKTILEGGKIHYSSYSHTVKDIIGIGEYNLDKGARDTIKEKLLIVYNKMKMKTVLDVTDKNFLSKLSFPVYKYLNTAVLIRADHDFDLITSQIAADQTKDLVLYLSRLVARGISSYVAIHGKDLSQENAKHAAEMIANINELNKQTMQYFSTVSANLENKTNILDYMRKKDQDLRLQSANQAFMTGTK
jgi:conjugative transfer pilus assembly protein TraH